MLNRIVQSWNQFSPRIKFMFVGLLVPLMFIFLMITLENYFWWSRSYYLIFGGGYPYLPGLFNLANIFLLLIEMVICGLLGFSYGIVYERISPRNKILAWALVIIAPLVICLIIVGIMILFIFTVAPID